MATLTRVQHPVKTNVEHDVVLDPQIPEPFPMVALRITEAQYEDDLLRDLDKEDLVLDNREQGSPSQRKEGTPVAGISQKNEILPSISIVQQACIMTLNNILSTSLAPDYDWQAIVPNRRHSMPSRSEVESTSEALASSSSALQTLVSNLRQMDGQQKQSSISAHSVSSSLLTELQQRVGRVSATMPFCDADLSQALVSLLIHIDKLSSLDPGALTSQTSSDDATYSSSNLSVPGSFDIYAELKRQVSDLQVMRLDIGEGSSSSSSPASTVERALLWAKIDEDLEMVLTLCRRRSELPPPSWHQDQLPPGYDDHLDMDVKPPEYDGGAPPDFEKSVDRKQTFSQQHSPIGGLSEKMKMDFDAVTMAIDRLYLVAPQLHNQRVELKQTKVQELERARISGKGKAKEREAKELDSLLDMINKAASRKLVDQSVILEGGMQSRLEKVKQRDNEKREQFAEQLVAHSQARRMHSQDAILQLEKPRNPEALLSLPEFIRESCPPDLEVADPEALLTLPEFVKQHPPPETLSPSPAISRLKKVKKSRNRSLSAPTLSWLRPGRSRSSSTASIEVKEGQSSKSNAGLVVRYVAEHHENLQHVLVFVGVDSGMIAGVDLEAEVPPAASDPLYGDYLILKCGTNVTPPLALPTRVASGKKEVRVQSSHYEIKLTTHIPDFEATRSLELPPSVLDAGDLTAQAPTSFICASCSLVIVQCPGASLKYRDLPSEHWTELLDAWMCHHDQKLQEQVAKAGRGFWPQSGTALVGGSYILFDETAVLQANTRSVEGTSHPDDWKRVKCICGAVIGRCQKGPDSNSRTYRLPKYAIRPVSPTAEPCRLPLSAFIMEDMSELIQAHATYRFIIFDEEEERPRLLMWIFKPNMRLAYATTAQYALPRTGAVQAAKILFKILGPETDSSNLDSVLDKYPGFPQAERLSYPINICLRLAGLLKESNTSYPMGMRVMIGLLVGWLRRS